MPMLEDIKRRRGVAGVAPEAPTTAPATGGGMMADIAKRQGAQPPTALTAPSDLHQWKEDQIAAHPEWEVSRIRRLTEHIDKGITWGEQEDAILQSLPEEKQRELTEAMAYRETIQAGIDRAQSPEDAQAASVVPTGSEMGRRMEFSRLQKGESLVQRNILRAARTIALEGGNPDEAFSRVMAEVDPVRHGPIILPQGIYANYFKQGVERYRPQKWLYDYAKGIVANAATLDPKKALKDLSPEQREILISFIQELSPTPEERGVLGKVGASIGRGSEELLFAMPDFLRTMFGGEEDRQLAYDALKLREAYYSGDIITGDNMFSQGLFDVSRMAPAVVASMASGGPIRATLAVWWPMGTQELYSDVRDAGVSDEIARPWSIGLGLAYGIVETLQLQQMGLGHAKRKAQREAFRSIWQFLWSRVKASPELWTKEMAEEAVQGAIKVGNEAIVRSLDEDVPDMDTKMLKSRMEGIGEELYRAAIPLAYMMAGGVGISSIRFDAKARLPRIGEVVDTERGKMEITEIDEKEGVARGILITVEKPAEAPVSPEVEKPPVTPTEAEVVQEQPVGEAEVPVSPEVAKAAEEVAKEATAAELYESGEVPEGLYVHGRADSQDWPTHEVFVSTNWNVADQFAGNRGSLWLVRLPQKAKVLDVLDGDQVNELWVAFQEDYNAGKLSPALDDVANIITEDKFIDEIDPDNIVESGELWDAEGFAGWVYDRFGYEFAKMSDGGLVIDPSVIKGEKVEAPVEPTIEEAEKVPVELAPKKPKPLGKPKKVKPLGKKPKPEAKPAPAKPLAEQTGEELIATVKADKKKPTGALKRKPAQYAEILKDADTDALKALRKWAKGDNFYVRKFLQPVIVAELQRRGEVQRKAEAEKRGKEVQAKKAAAEERKPALRKARREQNKVMRALQDEIISQFEIESGESVETLQIIEEEAAEEAGANFTFSGKLPGEITDSFRDPKTGKVKIPAWFRQIVTWNTGIGGKAGGSEMVSRLGGAGFIKRARAIFDGKAGRINASLDAAEKWARTGKFIKDTALLLKVERARALQAQLIGEAETPTETINVSDLKAGDTFDHLGDTFTVEREEGGAVIIKDGEAGHLFDGETIPIDKGTLNKRKGVFKESTVEAAKKRISDKLGDATFFINPLDPGLIKDIGIVIIDKFAEGVRGLNNMIREILADNNATGKTGDRLAKYVRAAWRKQSTRDAIVRIGRTQKGVTKAAEAAAQPLGVGRRVRALGRPPAVEHVTLSSRKLVNLVLSHESKASREAFQAGAKEIVAKHKDLAAYASDRVKGLPLSEADQAKLRNAVTRARTPGEQLKAIAAIEAVAERGKRNDIIDKTLKEARQAFNKVKGRTDFELTEELESVFEIFRKTTDARAVSRAIMRAIKKRASVGRPIPSDFPIWNVLARLDDAGLVPMNRIPTDLLLDTVTSLQGLVHSEATHNQLMATEKYESSQAMTEQATADVTTRHKKKLIVDMTKFSIWRQFMRMSFRWPSFRAFLVEKVGGQTGPVMDVLHKNLRQAEANELAFHQERLQFFAESIAIDDIDIKKFNVRKWAKTKVEITIGGKTVKVKQGELAGLLGNLADSNTRALLLSEEHKGLEFASNTTVTYKLAEDEIPGIEAAATAETKAVVKAIMGWYNGPQLAKLNAAFQQLNGRDLTRRTDRYPRRMDRDFLRLEPNKLVREWTNRQAEQAGQFKVREGWMNPVIIGDIITTFEQDTKVAGVYVTKQAETHDATRLLGDTEFRRTVKARVVDGANMLRRLEQEVKDFHGLATTNWEAVDKLLGVFYRNFHVAVLGFKPHIAMYQFVSYMSATTDIDFKYWAHRPYLPTKARVGEMSAAHPELAARMESSAYSLFSPVDFGTTQRLGTEKKLWGKIQDFSMSWIKWMDNLAIVNIYEAAKKEGRTKGLTGDALTKFAGQRAVDVIDATQPTWGIGNSSGVALAARRNVFIKPLAMFSSQTAKYGNRFATAILRYSHGEISFGRMVKDTVTVTFLQAAMIHAIQTTMFWVYSGFQPGPDDEDSMWDKAVAFGLATIRKTFGLWLIGREVAVPIAAKIEAEVTGKYVPYYADSPLMGFGKSAGRAFDSGMKVIDDWTSDKGFLEEQKADARFWKAATDANRFFSIATGAPTQGPATILKKALSSKTVKQAFDAERSRLRKLKAVDKLSPVQAARYKLLNSAAYRVGKKRSSIRAIDKKDKPLGVKRKSQHEIQTEIDAIYEKVMTKGAK